MATTAVVQKYTHYESSCIRKKTAISTELFFLLFFDFIYLFILILFYLTLQYCIGIAIYQNVQIKYMTLLYFLKNDELGEKLPRHQSLFTDRKFIKDWL